MHPHDEYVTEYQKLLGERIDLDRQLAKLKPIQARRDEIEKRLEDLRAKATLAAPAQQ